ncbi:MAG: hypothetical protein DRH26_07580 [Deltaproteobacteria bacterium]|nr:MAG: hypothetical protein DRH26_07580 [Deltaproteobacteria bacterium]
MELGDPDKAIENFDEAIAQEKGKKDRRAARTYRMNFIDYFPHREMGVAYFEKGNMNEAKKEIELSLQQYPTDKARVYLDRVRIALIDEAIEKGRAVKTKPKIDFHLKEYWTDSDYLLKDISENPEETQYEIWTRKGGEYNPVVISGEVKDEQYVTSPVIIKDKFFHFEEYNKEYAKQNARERVSFREYLTLSQGRNDIQVRATNLMGETSAEKVVFHVDREGPMIAIDNWTRKDDRVTLKGSLYDKVGIAEFFIQGENSKITAHIPFAKDIADNRLSTFFYDGLFPNDDILTLIGRDQLGNEKNIQIPINPINYSSSLFASSELTAFNLIEEEPAINLEINDLDENEPVYTKDISFNINITSFDKEVKIAECLVFLKTPSKSERRVWQSILPGVSVGYTPVVKDLEEGKNAIRIEARNGLGEKEIVEYYINREIPETDRPYNRLHILIFPFGYRQYGENLKNEKITQISKEFQEFLINGFRDERFNIRFEREDIDVHIGKIDKLNRTKAIEIARKICYFQFTEQDLEKLKRDGIKLSDKNWLGKEYKEKRFFLSALRQDIGDDVVNQNEKKLLSGASKIADYVITGSLINHQSANASNKKYSAIAKLIDIGKSNVISDKPKEVYKEMGDWESISKKIAEKIYIKYDTEFPIIKTSISELPNENLILIPIVHSKLDQHKKLIVFRNKTKGDGYIKRPLLQNTEAIVEPISGRVLSKGDFVATR